MPYSIKMYQDQLIEGGATSQPLSAKPRVLFVRFGQVNVNGKTLHAGDSMSASDETHIQGVDSWSQIWRWEVDLPNQPELHMAGDGLLTLHRMSRVITMLDMPIGSQWLFRLDQITAPKERVTDPHQHPGPGIRCMMEGTFNVQQDAESTRLVNPGDPWWESGRDEVIAWGSLTMHARFLRGMVLPAEKMGEVTGKWKAGEPGKKRGNWTLHVDELFNAPEGGY